jgi:hypothetical protein
MLEPHVSIVFVSFINEYVIPWCLQRYNVIVAIVFLSSFEEVYRLIHDMLSSQGVMTSEIMVKGCPKNGMWHEGCLGLEK